MHAPPSPDCRFPRLPQGLLPCSLAPLPFSRYMGPGALMDEQCERVWLLNALNFELAQGANCLVSREGAGGGIVKGQQ